MLLVVMDTRGNAGTALPRGSGELRPRGVVVGGSCGLADECFGFTRPELWATQSN